MLPEGAGLTLLDEIERAMFEAQVTFTSRRTRTQPHRLK